MKENKETVTNTAGHVTCVTHLMNVSRDLLRLIVFDEILYN